MPVLFIDRNLGKHIIAETLTKAGIPCEIHDAHLPQSANDQEWLGLVGKRGWIAISRDKNIRYRGPEKAALIEAGAGLIVISIKTATGKEIAELLIRHIHRIHRFVRKHRPPFIASMTRDGKITACKL